MEKEFARNRIAASHAFTVGEQQKAEHELLGSIKKMLILLQNNPKIQLEYMLNDIINAITNIGVSIRDASYYYNGTVKEYNAQLRKFPSKLMVRLLDYREINLFNPEPLQIPEEAGVHV